MQTDLRTLNVTAPEFFKAMETTLQKEDLKSWQAYLRWHVVHANAPYLSAAFVNADFDFSGKTLAGAQELEPRWKRCVDYADNDLGEALGQAYVQKAFPPEAKERALQMVKQIEAGHADRHRRTVLDVCGDQAEGSGEIACRGQQDRVSGQVARLQRPHDCARR